MSCFPPAFGFRHLAALGFLAATIPAVAADGRIEPLRVNPDLLGRPPASAASAANPPRTVAPAEFAMATEPLTGDGPRLQATSGLGIRTRTRPKGLPTFIYAETIAGKNDQEVIAEGRVELRKLGTVLESDRLVYWQERDEMEATGKVRLEREGDTVAGPKMRLRMDDNTGFFDQPVYTILRGKSERPTAGPPTIGHGKADIMLFEGEDHYRLKNATYSTCGPDRDPDWFVRVSDLKLDYEREVGTGINAAVYFRGAPILYSPYMSFSLNNKRKSGLLTPTFGSTSTGGMEYTQPVYWDIAPNMDATVSPRFMAKRGTQWNGEYRYLNHNYNGTTRYDQITEDKITHTKRYSYSLAHAQNFGYGISGTLNLNGASDSTYFTDTSTQLGVVAQTFLLRQGTLSYNAKWWSASLLAQDYQVLQDPSQPPLVAPYRRQPQLNLTANRADLPLGFTGSLNAEHVNFRHESLIHGSRLTLYPQLSLPIRRLAYTITPKLGLHMTRYDLDRPPALGESNKISRDVPVASLDSQVFFDRTITWFDNRAYTNTLEPRLFYVYIPVRKQDQIPVFDTGIQGFDYAQMTSEHRYSGNDRVGDANQITGLVTSRLVDATSGQEFLRGTIGQRLYFTTQQVVLPGEAARTDHRTDLLMGMTGRVYAKSFLDAALQYNPHVSRIERFNFSGRYQPDAGKVINLSYRYNADQFVPNQPELIPGTGLEHIDLSGQWPVWGGWSAAGRFNYSIKESRVIESIGGLEFNGGCWVARVVGQRLATQTQQSTTSLFFQLELNGFSKIGSNPIDILKRNIPGYGIINKPVSDPVFAAR